MNTLTDFIRAHGRKQSAEILGLEIRTVDSYLYGQRTPSTETAKKIIQRSNGQLSWDSIYGKPAA